MLKIDINPKKNKHIVLFMLLSIAIISCNEKGYKIPEIPYELKQEWKKDTFGCLGNRNQVLGSKLLDFKAFIGFKRSVFIEFFGDFNHKRNTEKGVLLLYWIDCGIAPKLQRGGDAANLNRVSTSARYMIVEVDENDTIRSIEIFMP